MSGSRPVTLVACGILVDRQRSRFLLGSRPKGKPYEGYWELPGGKLEAAESPLACLEREFSEELGIRISQCRPWVVLENDYPHAYVRLHIFRIFAFEGQLQSREGQSFSWFQIGSVPDNLPLLPMVSDLLRWLTLPEILQGVQTDQAGNPVAAGLRGAFVRDAAQIRLAAQCGAQFAVARSRIRLDWNNSIPVYEPGDCADDLEGAQKNGAHGIVLRA